MPLRPSIALIAEMLPPWLVANFNATAEHIDLSLVVLDAPSQTADIATTRDVRIRCVPLPDRAAEGSELFHRIELSLASIQPDAVLTFGWNGGKNLATLSWALRSGTPAIVTTDSNDGDFPRSALKEAFKRRLLALFSAGWAAGSRSTAYLEKLGMPKERIVTGPVDSVDLRHFEAGADAARNDAAAKRAALGLPERYFLAVSRLSPEKNLPSLVRAFARYKSRAGAAAWELVIVGEGPSRPDIEQAIVACGLAQSVTMAGWVGFDDTPTYYGLASAFILASVRDTWAVVVNEAAAAGLPILVSNRVGSAPDLVDEGRNGFTFDPSDTDQIAACLWRVANGNCDLATMGAESRKIIAQWNPEHYAASLLEVTRVALNMPRVRSTMIDRAIVRILASSQLRQRRPRSP
ncbi:MAG: glycosyltransferase [Hyphomicrobium sp.]